MNFDMLLDLALEDHRDTLAKGAPLVRPSATLIKSDGSHTTHKYISKRPDGKGSWVYTYRRPDGSTYTSAEKPMRAVQQWLDTIRGARARLKAAMAKHPDGGTAEQKKRLERLATEEKHAKEHKTAGRTHAPDLHHDEEDPPSTPTKVEKPKTEGHLFEASRKAKAASDHAVKEGTAKAHLAAAAAHDDAYGEHFIVGRKGDAEFHKTRADQHRESANLINNPPKTSVNVNIGSSSGPSGESTSAGHAKTVSALLLSIGGKSSIESLAQGFEGTREQLHNALRRLQANGDVTIDGGKVTHKDAKPGGILGVTVGDGPKKPAEPWGGAKDAPSDGGVRLRDHFDRNSPQAGRELRLAVDRAKASKDVGEIQKITTEIYYAQQAANKHANSNYFTGAVLGQHRENAKMLGIAHKEIAAHLKQVETSAKRAKTIAATKARESVTAAEKGGDSLKPGKIRLATPDGHKEVEGKVIGNYGVHEQERNSFATATAKQKARRTVTHLPTGYKVGDFDTPALAARAAKLWHKHAEHALHDAKFGQPDPKHPHLKTMGSMAQAIREHVTEKGAEHDDSFTPPEGARYEGPSGAGGTSPPASTSKPSKPAKASAGHEPSDDPGVHNANIAKQMQTLKKLIGAEQVSGGYKGTGSKSAERQIWVRAPGLERSVDVWIRGDHVQVGGINHPPGGKKTIQIKGRNTAEIVSDIASALKSEKPAAPKLTPEQEFEKLKTPLVMPAFQGRDMPPSAAAREASDKAWAAEGSDRAALHTAAANARRRAAEHALSTVEDSKKAQRIHDDHMQQADRHTAEARRHAQTSDTASESRDFPRAPNEREERHLAATRRAFGGDSSEYQRAVAAIREQMSNETIRKSGENMTIKRGEFQYDPATREHRRVVIVEGARSGHEEFVQHAALALRKSEPSETILLIDPTPLRKSATSTGLALEPSEIVEVRGGELRIGGRADAHPYEDKS